MRGKIGFIRGGAILYKPDELSQKWKKMLHINFILFFSNWRRNDVTSIVNKTGQNVIFTYLINLHSRLRKGPSWSWSYGS